MNEKTIILIPAFNQESELYKVLCEGSFNGTDILVIDDGSNDNTSDIAQKSGAKVLKNDKNMGYGATFKRGLAYAESNGYRRAVTLDADGAHDFQEISYMITR